MRAFVALVLCVQAALVLSDCSPNPCPSFKTCCPSPHAEGVVGCCPAPNAVCCSDKLHCCPQNTVCNLEKGTCDEQQDQLIPFPFQRRDFISDISDNGLKAVEIKAAQKVENVYCPGGTAYCPDGNTCCIGPSGQWRCCPLGPSAVCCNDKLHCCPYGSRCDSTSHYCLHGDFLWAIAPKRLHTLAIPIPVQPVLPVQYHF